MKRKKSHKDQAIELANKRAYARRYYEAHLDESREYYQENKDKIKRRAAAWRKRHRARYLKQQSDYDQFKRTCLTSWKHSLKHANKPEKPRSTPLWHYPSDQ